MSNNIGPYQQDFTDLAFFCDIANTKCFSRNTNTTIRNLSPVVTTFGGERSGTVLPPFSPDNGGYLTLDGFHDQYIAMYSATAWATADLWSLSIWFRLLSTPVNGDVLVLSGSNIGTANFFIDCENNYFRSGSRNSVNTPVVYSNQTIDSFVNKWVNVVVTGDNGVGLRMYINGEFENAAGYINDIYTITGNFSIGYNNASNYTDMDFSILQYYKRILSADEIKRHFNAYRGRYGI